jgi:RNA-directed DNA polymerase
MMHDREKSDPPIVARKPANADGQPSTESVERRGGAEGNALQPSTLRTPSRDGVTAGLERLRTAARLKKKERFTALLHHVSPDLLRSAYSWLKRDAAAGVDGVTWEEYGSDLDRRLADLHARFHRGSYRAQPSLRRFIPKPDGRQRPLGITAVEDKIVQRALVEVRAKETSPELNAIWEEDFLGFSYGFRPGRGQHDALDALAVGIETRAVNWILDADIAGFFDAVSHDWLIRFVEHRVGDRRVVRLIGKWLKAGVIEDGQVIATETGTPQGAVVSPLLANIYLHYVFDLWAERWRRREATGEMSIVRGACPRAGRRPDPWADDIVVGFQHQADAVRFWAEMTQRLAAFALTLHPEKTRLIEFGRRAAADRAGRGLGRPETFDFLGFTHICGRSRAGRFQLRRRTRRDRMRAKLHEIRDALWQHRHAPLDEQGSWLRQVVSGYFACHAVPTNSTALSEFRGIILWHWLRALRRRGQRDKTSWASINRLADRWIPRPRILHPWPRARFAVKHPRWEPYAGNLHVRFCAGGAQ